MFKILMCIGNKVDHLPCHPVRAVYRRHLQKLEDEGSHYYKELSDGGILKTEGITLLAEEEPSLDIRRSCLEWCNLHNIEFIEACASNADFDKCLSVDGDSQRVERVFGALSAHMWPGMILKSGDKILNHRYTKSKSSEEQKESDYEFDYEILSAGSAETWDGTDVEWVSASDPGTSLQIEGPAAENISGTECSGENGIRQDEEEFRALKPETPSHEKIDGVIRPSAAEPGETLELQECGSSSFYFEDLEQLMSEIGNIRDNLCFMPDFQSREMAAKLAMKMASMFGGGSSDEEE